MKALVSLNKVGIDYIFHRESFKYVDTVYMGNDEKIKDKRFKKHKNRYIASVLEDISFKFGLSQKIGITGDNGSGKTTLLKVLAGLIEPTEGSVTIHGRIASMMTTGAGFDKKQTGRENILRRGIFMGMSVAEIREVTDDIITFAELGPYLDLPIETYSAGMLARLGFAITTAVQADIIIMDEWIGAGDRHFMERAKKRLESVIARSQILILASHNTKMLETICDRIITLNKGKIVDDYTIDHNAAAAN